MSNVEKLVVVGIYGAIFLALFAYFTSADLPSLLGSLESWQPPKEAEGHKAHRQEPIVSLIEAGKEAEAPLAKVVSDRSRPAGARIGAAIALGHLKAGSAAASLARALETAGVDEFAKVALRQIGADAIEALEGYLAASTDEAGRSGALDVLGKLGGTRALVQIDRAIQQDKNAKVRRAAAVALNSLKGHDAAVSQARGILDTDPEVRTASEQGLAGRHPKELAQAAQGMINDADARKRRLAVVLVRSVREPEAKNVLDQGFRDPDLGVATAAALGLPGWFKDYPRDKAPFAERLKELITRVAGRRQLEDLALAAADGQVTELLDFFKGWLAQGKLEQRLAACAALARLADKGFPGEGLQFADDPDPEVKKAVHACLRLVMKRSQRDHGDLAVPIPPALEAEAPVGKAAWEAWWAAQQKVYAVSDEAAKKVKQAEGLIQTRDDKKMREGKKLAEEARELLLELAKLTGRETGTIQQRMQHVNELVMFVLKHSRPTDD